MPASFLVEGVPGERDQLHAWIPVPQYPVKLKSAHDWHRDVGDHGSYLTVVRTVDVEGVLAIMGGQDSVAQVFQHGLHDFKHEFVVLNEENRLATAAQYRLL